MSDTPETDAAVLMVNLGDADNPECLPGEMVHPSFARKLERQRNEMLEILEELSRYPVASEYDPDPSIDVADMEAINAAIKRAKGEGNE